MSTAPAIPAALLRGAAAGALTATLAVAAHSAAGGAVPSGAAAVLLALLSAVLGAVAGSAERLAEPRMLVALLAAGQVLGHLTLAAAGHSHAASLHPTMLLAHLLAVGAGAVLIGGADRLCRALSGTVRGCMRAPVRAPLTLRRPALPRVHQPLQSRLLIAVSISHRGPPAALR